MYSRYSALVGLLALGGFLLPTNSVLAQASVCSGLPTALDGQCLASQSAATQAAFNGSWGSQAAQEWVTEHNAALAAQVSSPPPPAPAPPAPPVSAPAPNALAQKSGGLPVVGFEQPCPNEQLGTGYGNFTIVGYAFDPSTPPGQGNGIKTVNISIYDPPGVGGSQSLGSVTPAAPDPHAGSLFGAQWQGDTRWQTTITLNTLSNLGGANIYAVAVSALTGKSQTATVPVSIVSGQGNILTSCG